MNGRSKRQHLRDFPDAASFRSSSARRVACNLRVMSRLAIRFLSLSLLVQLVGCGDSAEKTYPVRGVVRFPDGQLLRSGVVEFEISDQPKPSTATGEIGPDGSFVLGTFAIDDGAMAGTHRAAVISDHPIGNGAERPGMIPPPKLHPKFREFRTSGLTFEVVSADNEFLIDVEYAVPEGSEE